MDSIEILHEYALRHIYGASYFGSGGAYGRVRCDANCRTEGWRDNGFVSGPERVVVIDPTKPARFIASGGDCIGREGREWSEAAEWRPGVGWRQPSAPDIDPPATGDVVEPCAPHARWGTHYDTIPHGNCYDPVHCDCECKGCAPVKVR